MREVTVPIPEDRIAEFYEKFGEFMSEQKASTGANGLPNLRRPPSVDGDDVPGWINDQDAEERARVFWDLLSDTGRETLGVLIDRALDEETSDRLSVEELVAATDNSKGASGLAGVFGAAGRATKAAQLPRYLTKKGDGDWSYIWNWDGQHYWVPTPVARLLASIR